MISFDFARVHVAVTRGTFVGPLHDLLDTARAECMLTF